MSHTSELEFDKQGDREIVVKRMLPASRERVFDALTLPELFRQWMYGPDGCSVPVCAMDLQVGGALRIVWRGPDGKEMGMRGEYREFDRPARIVHVELFDEDWTGGETQITTELFGHDDHTHLQVTIRYPFREARDKALDSPMREGMATSYDRLETLLPTMS